MGFAAQILADSISPAGQRLTTAEITYPHAVHKDLLRHRALSRSVLSFRALPTEKLYDMLENDPYVPETFTTRRPGMSGGEPLPLGAQGPARDTWLRARDSAVEACKLLVSLGVAKEQANTLIQDYCWITEIVTATEWDNLFALRMELKDDGTPMARAEVFRIASMLKEARDASTPVPLDYGQWHLPLVRPDELEDYGIEQLKRISAGRCARISFDRQHESEPYENTERRTAMLLGSGHLSPFEHVARPIHPDELDFRDHPDVIRHRFVGNFRGWFQMRYEILHQDRYDLLKEVAAA